MVTASPGFSSNVTSSKRSHFLYSTFRSLKLTACLLVCSSVFPTHSSPPLRAAFYLLFMLFPQCLEECCLCEQRHGLTLCLFTDWLTKEGLPPEKWLKTGTATDSGINPHTQGDQKSAATHSRAPVVLEGWRARAGKGALQGRKGCSGAGQSALYPLSQWAHGFPDAPWDVVRTGAPSNAAELQTPRPVVRREVRGLASPAPGPPASLALQPQE